MMNDKELIFFKEVCRQMVRLMEHCTPKTNTPGGDYERPQFSCAHCHRDSDHDHRASCIGKACKIWLEENRYQ